MVTQQNFLMDDKRLGKLCKVEIFNISRKKKGGSVTKKNYVITVYNKVKVNEEVFDDIGNKSVVVKDRFVKWGEFKFQEAMHPKDRIIQALSKIELPLDYISDVDLSSEVMRREIVPLQTLPDEDLVNEVKRRGLTEFANVFKISKSVSKFEKLKSILKERRKIPETKLSFEDTIKELKDRKVLLPKDFLTDDELIHEAETRGIPVLVNRLDELLLERNSEPEQPQAPAVSTVLHVQEPIDPDEPPVNLEVILGKSDGQ
ncbi:MAG: hypothetical protein PHN44_02340 [Candidatus Marinimicrobia bacterium]|nr:hypothetical protein [Candidatus Neomarinimicrobiota bacterium]